jgi:ATP-binding cassette subfamily B protein
MGSCAGSAAGDWDEEDAKVDWDRELLRRVLGYFVPYWRRGLVVLALMAVGAVLGLVPALVTKALLDYLARPGGRLSHLALLIGAGVGATIVGGLLVYAQSFIEAGISQGIMFELRRQLYDHLLRQSVGYFTERRTGEVMSRISNDVAGIQDVVSKAVFGVASNLLVLPATLVLMVVLDWRLTLLLPLLVVPWVVESSRRVARWTYQARQQTQEQLGRMTAYLQEALGISGILLIKAFVQQRAERARFYRMNSDLRRLQLREARIERRFDMLMEVLEALAPAVFWLFGGYLVLRGEATIGTVVTFVVVLMGRLAMSVIDLAKLHVNVTGSLALFQRLFEVLDEPVVVSDAPVARPLAECRGVVAFENVTFAYGSGSRRALHDVSFEIQRGQLVALVGPTGAGKSTVTYLVARFYDPQQGRVLVDGHDVRELTLESLGGHIGIVFQDTFLFHTSIGDNLRYARPEASDDELTAAAKAAYLHDFIMSLPDGYDSVVGERGHRLSGGEKQRLAIARAILKDPAILVLDEATSHLDTVSEHLIQAALAPLFKGRTSLVIAHRLSTILAADLILVLDHGRLVEQGTHSELVRVGGLYAQLYERQFLTQAVETPLSPASPR